MSPAPAEAPSLPPISRLGTRDRLAGHENHLTSEQSAALDEFKSVLADKGYYTPSSSQPSHDDTTLLRFLRARKFDVQGAYVQFTRAEDWRRRENVAQVYDDFPVDEMQRAAMVYPQWTGRRDRLGLPLYLFQVGKLTKDAISRYNKEPDRLDKRMIALYEHLTQFALPFCSSIPHKHSEVPVSATTTIVDISNVSLSRFWNLRSHMQRASTLATANYAETLGAIYIVGAPNFFSTVWKWIGAWFDPGTVEKIFILGSHEVFTVLSRFIDPADIPRQYGGELDFDFGAGVGPNLDDAAKDTLGFDALPRGSLRWEHGQLVLKGTNRSDEELAAIEKSRRSQRSSRASEKSDGETPNGPSGEKVAQSAHRESAPTADTAPSATPAIASVAPVEKTTDMSEPTPASATLNATHEPAHTDVDLAKDGAVAAEAVGAIPGEDSHSEHDIMTAAREHPAAPVKELAAALEGTTL